MWRNVCDEVKYHELVAFGDCLPKLRRRIATDLEAKRLTKTKVLATVLTVMERTGVRVGNSRYAEENRSYGLTTLLDRHARFEGSSVEFSFRGKGGKPYHIRVRDRRLASIVQRCRDIPGQRLFQYLDADGNHQSISSTDVNRYIRNITGGDFTAKTFRTWIATVMAAELLAAQAVEHTKTKAVRRVNSVLRSVAEQLGNTMAICRKSYVDPRVLDAYSDGTLHEVFRRGASQAGLSRGEACLLRLLKQLSPSFALAA
jgi:DNA topoisomerase-1